MRGRTVTAACVALGAALAASRASAAELYGWLGGQADRLDTVAPDRGSELRLHLDTALNGSGYFIAPGEIDWNANVAYGRNRRDAAGGGHLDDNLLTFGAHTGFFDSRKSSFKLRLDASRSQVEFWQTTPGVDSRPGTSLTNTLAAGAVAGGGAFPVLDVRGYLEDGTTSSPVQPDVHRAVKGLDASARHGTDWYSYDVSYRGRLERGSLTPLDYTSHYVTMNGTSKISDATDFAVYGQYFTRSPQASDGINPKYDDTALTATTTTRFAEFTGRAQYAFSHFTIESATASSEIFQNSVTASGDRRLTPEWTLVPSVNVTYTQSRVEAVETTGTSESVGTLLRWGRSTLDRTYSAEGGVRLGLAEPAGAGTQLAWGASGVGGYGRNVGASRFGATYNVSYDTNTTGVRGWVLGQGLSGNYATPLVRDMSLSTTLRLDANRNHSDLVGDGASRTATFTATLQWPTRTVGLSAFLSDAVTGSLENPIRGDGLLIPPGFQTHSRGAQAFLQAPVGERWLFFAKLTYGSVSGPDFPEQRELIAVARAGYRIGQFTLTAQDVFTAAGRATFDTRRNEFMLLFARHFRL
ncbi:MAG TPA: hypothetical protein VIV57_06130 [Anaeromyxobacter sp.]